MGRWLAVRPVPRRHPEARDPVHRLAAVRAVEDEFPDLVLEVRSHVQQLEAEHLRVERHGMGATEAGVECLVDERTGFASLLAQDSDRPLEDVALEPAASDRVAWAKGAR